MGNSSSGGGGSRVVADNYRHLEAENERLMRDLSELKQSAIQHSHDLLDQNERLRKEVASQAREVGALRTALSEGAEDILSVRKQLQQSEHDNAELKKEIASLSARLAVAEGRLAASASAGESDTIFRIVSVHGRQKLSSDQLSGKDVLFAM
jgi:septal ring factor EnvC (AmiA/AmiB activator)